MNNEAIAAAVKAKSPFERNRDELLVELQHRLRPIFAKKPRCVEEAIYLCYLMLNEMAVCRASSVLLRPVAALIVAVKDVSTLKQLLDYLFRKVVLCICSRDIAAVNEDDEDDTFAVKTRITHIMIAMAEAYPGLEDVLEWCTGPMDLRFVANPRRDNTFADVDECQGTFIRNCNAIDVFFRQNETLLPVLCSELE